MMPQPELDVADGGALLAPLGDALRARLAPWTSPALATVFSLQD